MLLLQLILYCLLFLLLVKCAARDSGLNCIYFYPKEYIDEAEKCGIIRDKDAVMQKGKHFNNFLHFRQTWKILDTSFQYPHIRRKLYIFISVKQSFQLMNGRREKLIFMINKFKFPVPFPILIIKNPDFSMPDLMRH